MITYVDTSTLLKLLIDEVGSDRAAQVWEGADDLASVSLTAVEARAALAAATRAKRITAAQHRRAKASLSALLATVEMIDVTTNLVTAAADLAEREHLRGYDAVHLAGALLVRAAALSSADNALCAAATRQGISVANPLVH